MTPAPEEPEECVDDCPTPKNEVECTAPPETEEPPIIEVPVEGSGAPEDECDEPECFWPEETTLSPPVVDEPGSGFVPSSKPKQPLPKTCLCPDETCHEDKCPPACENNECEEECEEEPAECPENGDCPDCECEDCNCEECPAIGKFWLLCFIDPQCHREGLESFKDTKS